MKTSRLVLAVALAGALGCTVVPAATAAPALRPPEVSGNWSGYEVSAKDGSPFSDVSGSWVQPSTNCSTGQGFGSFWVGLGGAQQQSQALEQVGTSADCGGDGFASDYAWYELVPSAPVQLNMSISPGDHMWGHVHVNGTAVSISLTDRTTGASFNKTLNMNSPDVSTAEWIAEAPSSCDTTGNCQPLPLSDFGTAHFTNSAATSEGHTGTISDPAWSAQPLELNSEAAGFVSTGGTGGATPSSLSADGSSFSVTASSGDQSSGSSGSYGGSPYGAGSPYGDGSPYGGGSPPVVIWIYG